MGNAKWVHLLFVGGGMVLAFLLIRTGDWVWGAFGRPNDLVVMASGIAGAAVLGVVAWRNESLFSKTSEIMNELSKVTWPDQKETSSATVVVIITTIISSLILGFFDLVWSWGTDAIYRL